MEYPWYSEVAKSKGIEQGDFIEGMNFPEVIYSYNKAKNSEKPNIRWREGNWIVLAQSCDLNPTNKKAGQYVVVGPVSRISDYGLTNKSDWVEILKNKKYMYHALKSSRHPISNGEFMVVNFQEARYAKLSVVKQYAHAKGNGPRLRLNSPYLENMSTRFGNTFARIAYPVAFPSKGDLQTYYL